MKPLSYMCDSLELMYANITSVSNLCLTGEALSGQCMYRYLCKQPLSYRCDIPWIGRCISRSKSQ
ncbi:hypothetical protein AHAS_Ahas12G0123700 [Arachis hypogaea]